MFAAEWQIWLVATQSHGDIAPLRDGLPANQGAETGRS